jgi:hypothetical protein
MVGFIWYDETGYQHIPIVQTFSHGIIAIPKNYLKWSRDGWLVSTTCKLIYILNRSYTVGIIDPIKGQPLIRSLDCVHAAFHCLHIHWHGVTLVHLDGDERINQFWKVWASFVCQSFLNWLTMNSSILFANASLM